MESGKDLDGVQQGGSGGGVGGAEGGGGALGKVYRGRTSLIKIASILKKARGREEGS